MHSSLAWICSVLVAGCVVLAPSFAHASKPDSVPDWVRAAAALPVPALPPETDAVVLVDETTLSVAADGRAVEHHRRAVKILRPTGRDYGGIFVAYDGDTPILSLHAWSMAPDGHPYEVKENELATIGYPGGGNFYEDMRARVANPPGRDPGGVIAYEYEQRTRPYIHEYDWFFQEEIPHLAQSLTLVLPAGFTYGAVWAHHAPAQAADLEHQRYRWEFAQTPGINLDQLPLHPSASALEGRMTLHYAAPGDASTELGTWAGEGDWYDRLSRNRMASNAEIAAKANELTAGKEDFYARTEAVASFVQRQIRYFVIEKGIGGNQPHPAADIFRNRYGDCKDKSTLLAAMLSSVGIHSALMLVDTHRGFIDPAAPSILGNHAIAAVEIPAGYQNAGLRSVVKASTGKRYLIVDPTAETTAFGQLPHYLQGGHGVLVEGAKSELVELPVLDPAFNTVWRSGNLALAADGTLAGTIEERRFGDLSERRRRMALGDADARQQNDYLLSVLGGDFPSFHVADVKVDNAASLNKDLTTTYHLEAGHFARSMGPLLMVRPRVLGREGIALDHKPRTVPIDLSETMMAKDDFLIELPPGYAVDELPDPVKLDLGFATYESASRVEGNALHYTRTYTVRQVELPADRYEDLRKLASTIEGDEQRRAVLKRN